MSISIREDHNNRKVFITIDRATHAVRTGLRQGLIEIGKENKRHAKRLIRNPPKTGRFYGKHQASAAGEAPANRTGNLMRSVRYRTYGWSRMDFGDFAPYGKYLEGGTKKMKPRPHLITTVNDRSGDNYTILAKTVDKNIKNQ